MRTLIAVPCMDMVHTDFLRSCLSMEKDGEVRWGFAQSSLIYDARNALANMAIDEGYDRVLWLDSDMHFDEHLFRRLSEHLDLGKEMITGLYFSRRSPIRPIVYKALYLKPVVGGQEAVADSFENYPKDDLFRVAGCGFGAVMMSVDLLKRVRDAFALPFFPVSGFGEDLAFCLRCSQLGAEIWCDSSIKLGHVGLAVYDEELYKRRDPHE